MNIPLLIKMANQIGAFFEAMPDSDVATADVAAHIKRFWNPQMRRALLAHADDEGDQKLRDIVRNALHQHRELLL